MDAGAAAEILIARFGSLRAVLAAPRRRLLAALGGNDAVAMHLRAISDALAWTLRLEIDSGPIIAGGKALSDYLRFVQGFEQVEVVRALYLDVRHRLLRDEVAARGTVDEAPIYVREIIGRALDLGAAGLVIVHNHPSGDVSPSQQDIMLTRRLAEGAKTMGLVLHDHLIVSAETCVSLRAEGLL